jgi:hypothetical protein
MHGALLPRTVGPGRYAGEAPHGEGFSCVGVKARPPRGDRAFPVPPWTRRALPCSTAQTGRPAGASSGPGDPPSKGRPSTSSARVNGRPPDVGSAPPGDREPLSGAAAAGRARGAVAGRAGSP